MIHSNCCPLCLRKVRWALTGGFLFVDCNYCSHYYMEDEAATSAYVLPLSEERIAHMAARNWEWGPHTYTITNLRAWPPPPQNDDFDRAVRRLLHVIYNSHQQQPFYLRFDDPMLMGLSSSPTPADFRRLIQEVLIDALDCANVTDAGCTVAVTSYGKQVAGVHLSSGPGLHYIHLSDAERRWWREEIRERRLRACG